MNIAIDLGLREAAPAPIFYHYVQNAVLLLAHHHPEHVFVIYNGVKASAPSAPNLTFAVRALRRQTWLTGFIQQKRPGNTDLLIECFHPGQTITQGAVVIIADLGSLLNPALFDKKKTASLRKSVLKILQHSSAVIVPSFYYKEYLVQQFQADIANIHVIRIPKNSEPEMEWQEKERIKEVFTSGKEYFLFAGDIHPRFDLITLLKAFSHFKKWQKSNMKLVIAGYNSGLSPLTAEQYASYKYKDDVVLIYDPDDSIMEQLTHAAYAFLYPALYDPFPVNVLKAISKGVPVICSDIPEIREMAADAVIYIVLEEMQLFQAMQRIYKEEAWRKDQVMKASTYYASLQQQENIQPEVIPLHELIAK